MDLVIAFVAAWVIRHMWEGKVDDLNASQKARQKQINQAHPNWSKDRRQRAVKNAARRNAAGWVAYQLRHGWIPTIGDVADGYRAAKLGHAEWLAQRPEGGGCMDGFWMSLKAAVQAGWSRAKAKATSNRSADSKAHKPDTRAPETGPGQPPLAAPSSPTSIPGAAAQSRYGDETDPATGLPAKQVHAVPIYLVKSQPAAKENTVSGETGGYSGAQHLTAGYQTTLTAAQDQLEQYEADLIAGGLAKDPQALSTLAAAREGLATAQAAFGTHQTALTSHEQGAEYAQDKGAAAAKTEWLGDGA